MTKYQAVLSSTKAGAPSTDRINALMLKAATDGDHQRILECMNNTLVPNAAVPEEWCAARIILIPKTGSLTNPANYRPIPSYKSPQNIHQNYHQPPLCCCQQVHSH
jgi:hypothetical protein